MTSEILKLFSAGESRPITAQPWSLGEFSYASDGRILVRVTRLDDVPENDKAPPVADYFKRDFALCVNPPPDLPFIVWDECSDCGGKGTIPANSPCKTCDGDGYRTCDLGHDHDCDDCKGRGTVADPKGPAITCEECDGKGRWEKGVCLAPVDGFGLNSIYVRKIVTHLTGVRFASMDQDNPVPFIFDGGCGVLMPMKT